MSRVVTADEASTLYVIINRAAHLVIGGFFVLLSGLFLTLPAGVTVGDIGDLQFWIFFIPLFCLYSIPGPLLVGPVAVFAVALVLVPALRPPRPTREFFGLLLFCVTVLGATWLLARTHLPKRFAFWTCMEDFDDRAVEMPVGPATLDEPIGHFVVRNWGKDPRGGSYFRTEIPLVLGPIVFPAYGFVLRPNRSGTPWGDQGLELIQMTGEWYSFMVTGE